jgi:hypothetical protein
MRRLPTTDITRRCVLAALAAFGAAGCASSLKLGGDERRAVLGGGKMKVGHIYATADGESHIGELDILLAQNEGRPLFYNSTRFPATAIGFQQVRIGGVTAWHKPPQPWLAFILVGTWEIEASDGARRQFPAGSVSLVEDTTGKGHRGWAVGDADVLVAAVSLPDEVLIASHESTSSA